MAQAVDFYENNVTFLEGPFVICNPLDNGWRIEAELKNYHCPVLPHLSICNIIKEKFGLRGKTRDRRKIERICDELNDMVRDGRIVLDGCEWVHRDVFSGRSRADDEKVLADYDDEKERQE